MFFSKKLLIVLCAICVATIGCKKERFKPTWKTNWLAPFFTTELKINHLVNDTLLTAGLNGNIQLVYNNTIFQWNPNEAAINIPDTTVRNSFKIAALDLADQTVEYDYTLKQFCIAMGPPFGPIILANDGNTMVVPAVPPQPPTEFPVDANQFFQDATLNTGFIDITVNNGFPIPIENVEIQLANASTPGTPLGTTIFASIPPGASQTQTIDLSGQYVEGDLVAKLLSIESPGSGGSPVLIDTTDAIHLTLLAHDMTVQEATAIFPDQNIVDENQETEYGIDGGAKLTMVRVKEGTLKLNIFSTLPQESIITYTLPSATLGGVADIVFVQTLPPAPAGSVSQVELVKDLAGYEINLQGSSGTSFNTFVNHLTVHLDSTGEPITLSANDSVYIDYGLTGIEPEYVRGYLGQQIINVGPDTSTMPIFKMIKGGTIGIEDVSVNLDIENSLGAEGRINVYDLKSIRSQTNNVVQLNAASFMNQPLFIPRATDNPLTPSHTSFMLNTSNSNIKDWLQNIPDVISYKMDVFMNPNGNTANYTDFAYTDARVALNMQLQMPLSLVASGLIIEDTIGFNALGNKAEGIQEATLYLFANNGFPLSASVQIQLLDENKWPLGSLTTSPLEIQSGITGSDCIVHQAVESVLTLPVPEQKLTWLRLARYAVITAVFDTHASNGCTDYLKIYDTYSLSCKLTGSVVYDVTP